MHLSQEFLNSLLFYTSFHSPCTLLIKEKTFLKPVSIHVFMCFGFHHMTPHGSLLVSPKRKQLPTLNNDIYTCTNRKKKGYKKYVPNIQKLT